MVCINIALTLLAICSCTISDTWAGLLGKSSYDKLEKWLQENVLTNNWEANYNSAKLLLEKEKNSVLKDKDLIRLIENWGTLEEARKVRTCKADTFGALNELTRDEIAKRDRLSRTIKELAMYLANECARADLQEIMWDDFLSKISLNEKYKLLPSQFLQELRESNVDCGDDEKSIMFESACNTPYAYVNQLARKMTNMFRFPNKITHDGKLPANMQSSSFVHAYHDSIVKPCKEYVQKSQNFFIGLMTLSGYWEENHFYQEAISRNDRLKNEIFRFHMCAKIRNDRQLDSIFLQIIAEYKRLSNNS